VQLGGGGRSVIGGIVTGMTMKFLCVICQVASRLFFTYIDSDTID
jgi:hypothetical protein